MSGFSLSKSDPVESKTIGFSKHDDLDSANGDAAASSEFSGDDGIVVVQQEEEFYLGDATRLEEVPGGVGAAYTRHPSVGTLLRLQQGGHMRLSHPPAFVPSDWIDADSKVTGTDFEWRPATKEMKSFQLPFPSHVPLPSVVAKIPLTFTMTCARASLLSALQPNMPLKIQLSAERLRPHINHGFHPKHKPPPLQSYQLLPVKMDVTESKLSHFPPEVQLLSLHLATKCVTADGAGASANAGLNRFWPCGDKRSAPGPGVNIDAPADGHLIDTPRTLFELSPEMCEGPRFLDLLRVGPSYTDLRQTISKMRHLDKKIVSNRQYYKIRAPPGTSLGKHSLVSWLVINNRDRLLPKDLSDRERREIAAHQDSNGEILVGVNEMDTLLAYITRELQCDHHLMSLDGGIELHLRPPPGLEDWGIDKPSTQNWAKMVMSPNVLIHLKVEVWAYYLRMPSR